MSYTSSIRSGRSATPSGVPRGIKRQVHSDAGSKCWLCKVNGKHVAHLIAQKDTDLLELYIKNGLINTTDINSRDNLILLCPTCHESFDMGTAAWVFLPCPLQPFLAAERDFQAARLTDPSATRASPRDGVVFQPYLIRERHTNLDWSAMNGPFEWGGEPVLAILRSNAIAAGLQRLPAAKGGVPQEVAEMYLELVGLYGTAAPVVDVSAVPGTAVMDSITVQQPLDDDTIRVVAPPTRAGTMGPPTTRGRGGRSVRVAEIVGDSVVASDRTAQSEDALNRWAFLNEWSSGRRKRPLEMDNVSQIESEAPSEQSARSNDTQFSMPLPRTRAAKRARMEAGW